MSQLRVFMVTIAAVVVLSGCGMAQSYREVKDLNTAQAVGSPFTQKLSSEYRDYANMLQDKHHDYPDAIHFGRKGQASARGEIVMPEDLNDWDLSDANLVEMNEARKFLVDALEIGGREVAPEVAAVAQARFDCWAEQQEENWNATPPCRNEFAKALAELNNAVASLVKPVAPEPAPMPAPAAEVQPEPAVLPLEQALFIAFFDWDKSDLTDGASEVLNAVANEVLKRNDIKGVVVVGHADRSGAEGYNQKLSERRAKAIEQGLIQRGVPANLIRISAKGETQPMVETADGVREPANRRAEISLE